jgi:hypothetical protein
MFKTTLISTSYGDASFDEGTAKLATVEDSNSCGGCTDFTVVD